MISDAPRRPHLRHVTTTGAALAAALLPLAAAVLLAKTMAGDPLAPVNTLITSGGQRVRISPSVWRRCGRQALSDWKPEPRPWPRPSLDRLPLPLRARRVRVRDGVRGAGSPSRTGT
ncbi:hypothetical protein ACGF5F_15235 [Streptomyces sp. NPDC047821]|uniref:hypothetical protein n=1 Tax=Streptomyces sp. NPDC047821 TaxID=3365488 RepID=UPI00371B7E7C